MKGHTIKRGKTWSYVIDVGREEYTDEDGNQKSRRKQQWKGGFRTKGEAQSACTEALNRFQQGAYVAPTKETLSSYLDDWLKSTRASVRPSRVRATS